MWNCAGCKEKIDEDFGACWQCGLARDGEAQSPFTPSVGEPTLPNGLLRSHSLSIETTTKSTDHVVLSLMRRYRDAYTSARWLIRLGTLVKFAAVILAIASIGAGAILSAVSSYAMWISFAIGGFVWIPTYVMGVLASGQGQTNLATLDTAVNTSRHLSDDDVADLLFS